jgi:hypothetical protein
LEKILLFPFYREENEDNLSRAVLRIKSMALCMLGMCCTDELYPQKGRLLFIGYQTDAQSNCMCSRTHIWLEMESGIFCHMHPNPWSLNLQIINFPSFDAYCFLKSPETWEHHTLLKTVQWAYYY